MPLPRFIGLRIAHAPPFPQNRRLRFPACRFGTGRAGVAPVRTYGRLCVGNQRQAGQAISVVRMGGVAAGPAADCVADTPFRPVYGGQRHSAGAGLAVAALRGEQNPFDSVRTDIAQNPADLHRHGVRRVHRPRRAVGTGRRGGDVGLGRLV